MHTLFGYKTKVNNIIISNDIVYLSPIIYSYFHFYEKSMNSGH